MKKALAFGVVASLWVFSTAHAQRSLRDVDSGGKKRGCKKVAVIVDGLRRMKCSSSDSNAPRIRNIGGSETKSRKTCTTSKSGKRNCKWISYFTGHPVAKKSLSKERLPKPSGKIWFYAIHFREVVKLNIYNKSGAFDESSLAALDEGFRCRRTLQTRAVDPRLFITLSRIQDHWPGKRVELVSGFRFQTNEGSRHYHASAMDIRVSGVDAQELYDYAETLDRGGMGIGIYPFARFVHIDFRAPGEKSYRWVDISPKNYAERGREVSDRASSN